MRSRKPRAKMETQDNKGRRGKFLIAIVKSAAKCAAAKSTRGTSFVEREFMSVFIRYSDKIAGRRACFCVL